MNGPPSTVSARLLETGSRLGSALYREVVDADLVGRVKPRHVHLCAALGLLAESSAEALGASVEHARRAGRAAAMLSLLTKIDDQVIDHGSFHGGMSTPRAVLRERARAYLQPTLDSILQARPATAESRCRLAARLGVALTELGPHRDRRMALLEEVAAGWRTQVDSVAVFSAHPAEVTGAQVQAVTAAISARWLRMVTVVGVLAPGAARALSAEEWTAFDARGAAIQRADALADLDKDLEDGLVSSLPAWELHGSDPDTWAAVCAAPALAHAAVAQEGLDERCMIAPGSLIEADRAQAALGRVPELLNWIHRFLLWRYATHPACQSAIREPLARDTGGFVSYLRGTVAWQEAV